MTIRNVIATGVATLSLGLAGFGVAAPAQAATGTLSQCLMSIPSHTLMNEPPSDDDDTRNAIYSCEDKAAATPAPMHSGAVVLPM